MVPFKYRHVRFFFWVYFVIPFHIWRKGEYPFPVHRGSTRFRAEEEQKLTAASVEAKKRESSFGCLWLEDRRFLPHTGMYSKTSRLNYGNLYNDYAYQLVKDSEKSTVAVDGA